MMDQLRKSRHLPLLLLLGASAVVGFMTLRDYGEGWDEADIRRYGGYALEAYRFLLHPADLQEFETNLNLYGPGYFAVAGLLTRLILQANSAWSPITAWHAINFLTFLGGAFFLYVLALRWTHKWAAFGAVLLFVTQPLFWGHAFINPKDIPFLVFFLATVVLGFWMVDGLGERFRLDPRVVLAGVMLGFTSSLRVLGPLAGLIVLADAGFRRRSSMWLPAGIYLFVAALTAYVCWPHLWAAPLSRFTASLNTMADFPFNSTILFAGQSYKADQLPVSYFPTLLGIQLTESAILLVILGLAFSIRASVQGTQRAPLLLFLGWFLLPTLVILGTRRPLYDNARQLFFLLPPLFIMAGLALDQAFQKIRQPLLQGGILLAVALPGVLIGARLHPYEYVYYNALVGGTGGAFREYEMDYWGTSFTDISREMNARVPIGSKVLVYGPEQIVAARARPDIQVFIPREDPSSHYDYVVLLTRSNADQRLCREAETIYAVGRRGAIFSELRSIPAGARCR